MFYDYHSDGGWDHAAMVDYKAQTPQVLGYPGDYPLVTQHGSNYLYRSTYHQILDNPGVTLQHFIILGANTVQ